MPAGPHARPRSAATSTATTATANARLPTTSKRAVAARGVSGSSRHAIATAIATSGAWIANTLRQPNASTSGPPTISPTTGAPAPTSDQ